MSDEPAKVNGAEHDATAGEDEPKPKAVRPIDGLRARVDGVEAIAHRALAGATGAALLALLVLALVFVLIYRTRTG